jgi:alkylation response protein AidB-like acyl-CoA dehydrogenase
MRYPEDVGGTGMALTEFAMALQEISRGSMSLAGAVAMQSLMGTKFLHLLGNEDIIERLFKPALRGEKIGAICMTEPNSGSDLDSIATTAKKVEGGYVINGQKTWITSAPVADFFTVFAKAGEEKKLTIFLVEKQFKGLIVGREIHKMGVWALPTSEVAFDECFVPDSHRLSQGRRRRRRPPAQDPRRDPHHHRRHGARRGARRTGRGRALRRRAQAVRQADQPLPGDTDEAGRDGHRTRGRRAPGVLRRLARDSGKPYHKDAAMAKLFATETAAKVCDQAARVFASYGYAMEYPVQRYLRDVRFTLIGGGTSEILKLIIAKEVSS